MSGSDLQHLELADVEFGAGEELSRGALLAKGALAVGALYGLAAIGPYVSRALAGGESDVDVLNFLLGLEYIQVSLYNRASSGKNDHGEPFPLKGAEKELVTQFLTEEGQHVKALQEMIEEMGGKPVKKGEYAFAFRVFEQFLELASRIETYSVRAYNGAIARLDSGKARELAYSIVQTDARHAAAASIGKHENPAPEPFEKILTEESAINEMVPFTGVYPELPGEEGGNESE